MEPKMIKVFDRRKVTLEKELGSGSFGRVCKATIADSKLPAVAVKILFPELQTSLTIRKAYEELNKVGSMEHDNIVKLIGMVEDDIPWLVFEYMKGGNLLEYVIAKKNIKERKLLKYCRDITRGMAYLHRNNILHKDLAARNILLDTKIAKISDMGLSSVLSGEQRCVNYCVVGKVLAFRHAATECIVEGIYTFESDVWSMGVLMFEITTGGAIPYGEENKEAEVRRIIADGGNPTHTKTPSCSDNTKFLIEYILQVKKEERPSFNKIEKIIEHILDGGSFSRRIPKSQPTIPVTIRGRNPMSRADTGSGSHANPKFLQVANSNLSSSTPNLTRSNPKSIPRPGGTHRGSRMEKAPSEGDFLEPPQLGYRVRIQKGKKNSDDSNDLGSDTNLYPSSLQNESFLFPRVPKTKFLSANNLNTSFERRASDIHDDIIRDWIPNRFQRKE